MTALQRRMLTRLQDLREGTTLCPGRLARDCGSTLAEARPDLLGLARAGKIELSQRGKSATPDALRGPFRVCLRSD